MFRLQVVGMAGFAALVLAGCSVPLDTSAVTTSAITPSSGASSGATSVAPGHASRVFTMAGLGRDCSATAHPRMTVDKNPAKGTVTFAPVEPTVVQYSLSGACIGKRVAAMGVFYTPRPGESGDDTFVVTAHAGRGTSATRTIRVVVAE